MNKTLKQFMNSKESFDTILQWHKDTFPDVTLSGQLEKFDEEMEEFFSAKKKKDRLEELADLVIVAVGLFRFDRNFGALTLNRVHIRASNAGFDMVELYLKVDEKMAINRKRQWEKTSNGAYHHTNKGQNDEKDI